MRSAFLLVLRAFLVGLCALAPVATSRAGIAPYSDRGKIDFDTAMSMLNPYGTWAKTENGLWAYTPLDHYVPYTNGRWIYTEYGWMWLGTKPHSWLTEHYGYWKRNEERVWSWYPGPYWLPQTVEIRSGPTAIGWRSAEVDDDGTFVESPAERYTKVDEWTFVTLQQFAGPITPAILTPPSQLEGLLEESVESMHSYQTYRDMDRPGPHPADLAALGDGKMLAPMSSQERAAAAGRPVGAPKAAGKGSDVPKPTLVGVDPDNPPADPRQVKYWITMSLPTLWTPKPADAKWNEVYIYRPEFWQDQDGIERRIALWLNPGIRATESLHLQEVLSHTPGHGAGASGAPGVAANGVPAVPADSGEAHSVFTSPFEDSFHPSDEPKTPSASTKNPKLSGGAPPPLSAAGAPVSAAAAPVDPVPVPIGTEAKPVPAPAVVIPDPAFSSSTNSAPLPATIPQ